MVPTCFNQGPSVFIVCGCLSIDLPIDGSVQNLLLLVYPIGSLVLCSPLKTIVQEHVYVLKLTQIHGTFLYYIHLHVKYTIISSGGRSFTGLIPIPRPFS